MADCGGRIGGVESTARGGVGRCLRALLLAVAAVVGVLGAAGGAAAAPPGPSASRPALSPTGGGMRVPSLTPDAGEIAPYSKQPAETQPFSVCPPPTTTRATCLAVGVPKPGRLKALGLHSPSYEGSGKNGGFSPADLRSAYGLPAEGGKGATVAISIAFDDPNAESDLIKYRQEYKLPECTKASGCFKKVNQYGEEANYPKPNADWAEETSLDLDMVSATCPQCHIILVEAKDNYGENLYPAVEEAVKLGATVVSDSWAGEEYASESEDDSYFNQPRIPILFASGDNGYGVEYPAASPYVVSVGGTSLRKAANTRGWSESAWSGAGSGCSQFESKPAWQKDEGCTKRTVADGAAVADPETPVSVYDTYESSGWLLLGGTSVATPLMAGVEALSTSSFRSAGPSAFSRAGQGGELFDPIEGENGLCGSYLCQAEAGYDGPTGWGTPSGTLSLPVAVTEGANAVSSSKATLHGSVRPGGVETKYHFEYGETTSYGSTAPIPDKSVGSGTEYVEVSQGIEGLKGQRTYHFRITATNTEGTFHGVDRIFGTTPPTVTTGAATEIHSGRATLNGTVNPEGLSTSYYFEYGPTSSYGSRVPLRAQEVGAGTKNVEVSAVAEGLGGGATYHYRVVAKSVAGTTFGGDKTFVTAAAEWRAQTLPQPEESSSQREANGIVCSRQDACIAVGSYWKLGSYHTLVTLAENWNGEEWSTMATPNPSGLEEGYKFNRYALLEGVSCGSASDCVAVGYYRGTGEVFEPLSEHWNGSEWKELSTPKPTGAIETRLVDVSCVSSTACEAVGSYKSSSGTWLTLAEGWNGTSWTVQSSPNPTGATGSQLHGVSCSSSTLCTTVGSYTNSSKAEKTLAERWNGSSWSEQSTPNPSGTSFAALQGVSCDTSSECTAVGYFQLSPHIVTLAEHWNGSTWTEQTTPTPAGEGGLNSVSCATTGVCTAAGDYYSSTKSDSGWRSLIERSSGATWSTLETEELFTPSGWWHESWLNSISCPEPVVCAGGGTSLSAPEGGLAQDVAFAEQSIGPPRVTTEEASKVGKAEATLNGTVNPNGVKTYYYFEYGPTTAYGSKTKEVSIRSGMSTLSVAQTVAELTTGTTYHFRIVASNGNGTTEGSDRIFTPAAKPTVETKPATGLTEVGATLNGSVTPNGAETKYFFEYGTSESYGSKTSEVSIGSGTKNVQVNKSITGLSVGTTYHFRIVASNSGGASYGLDETFHTPTWAIEEPPNPKEATSSHLSGVSCRAAAECVAVGNFGPKDLPVAETWNGTSWSIQEPPIPAGAVEGDLSSVSCVASNSCVAVGSFWKSGRFPLAETWNGTSWSIQEPPKPKEALSSFLGLNSVSCTSSSACVAVGQFFNKSEKMMPFVETWNGTSWSVLESAIPVGASEGYLKGVSCSSSTACTAVGKFYSPSKYLPLAERWNGTSWSLQEPAISKGAYEGELMGVSCPGASSCTAVGSSWNSTGGTVPMADAWNGTSWSALELPKVTGATQNHLKGVSCVTTTACSAVGDFYSSTSKYTPMAESLTSGSWSVHEIPSPAGSKYNYLLGESCASTSFCFGVGEFGNESGTQVILAARFQ
jgi:hypothetical protein